MIVFSLFLIFGQILGVLIKFVLIEKKRVLADDRKVSQRVFVYIKWRGGGVTFGILH